MKKYSKRKEFIVTAVQLNLNTEGLNYKKWGSNQLAKSGDWVVDNNGECYTINKESFEKTYKMLSPGVYHKEGFVWAEKTTRRGWVSTKEGKSHYNYGDYIVCNNEDLTDAYCVSKEDFENMYEEVFA